jgi:hypothetical protein
LDDQLGSARGMDQDTMNDTIYGVYNGINDLMPTTTHYTDYSTITFNPGSFVRRAELSEAAQQALFCIYKDAGVRVYRSWDCTKPYNGFFLTSVATYIRHVDIDGRRITAVYESKSTTSPARSSIVKVIINSSIYVGEVLRLFYHDQEGILQFRGQVFAEMRWMVRVNAPPIASNPWSSL